MFSGCFNSELEQPVSCLLNYCELVPSLLFPWAAVFLMQELLFGQIALGILWHAGGGKRPRALWKLLGNYGREHAPAAAEL